MSGPGFARPDICSIGAVASQERIGGAPRGVRSADGHLLNDDDRHVPMASSIDHAIRLSTAAAVLAVAAIAAYVSYWHAYAVVRAHGEAGITARLEPVTVQGRERQHHLHRPGVIGYVRSARSPTSRRSRSCPGPSRRALEGRDLLCRFSHAARRGPPPPRLPSPQGGCNSPGTR
jgi:hypothetical protein